MKIYTKTGDDGETGLMGGARIKKNSLRIAAIGDVDELNAAIGVARCEGEVDDLLSVLQSRLFDLGGELASPADARVRHEGITQRDISKLEQSIDRLTAELPPLKNFILPGGSKLAANLHLARSICRRAERSVLDLHEQEPVREEVRVFLNRLSDWLFVAARTANQSRNVLDTVWQKRED